MNTLIRVAHIKETPIYKLNGKGRDCEVIAVVPIDKPSDNGDAHEVMKWNLLIYVKVMYGYCRTLTGQPRNPRLYYGRIVEKTSDAIIFEPLTASEARTHMIVVVEGTQGGSDAQEETHDHV